MKVIPLPSQERLKELFDYDKDTGLFIRIKKSSISSNDILGDIAGCRRKYIMISVDGRQYCAQRLAWMYATGEDPGELEVDHDDKNKHNNAFGNLRKATKSQNQGNRGSTKANKVGLKGVIKRKNRYIAQIAVKGKKKHLGCFQTKEEAHKAYCDAADKYHGRFASY